MNVFKQIPGLTFRPMTPGDARDIAYIELEIFPIPWSEQSLRSFLTLSDVEGEVAICKNEIIAYVFVQYVEDEAHILNFGVRSGYRRKGLAAELMHRLLNRIRERVVNICYLEVRASNLPAQKLYFKYGFAPITVRKNYYPDGEDALILARQF
ncbi:ribosomal-protein-alanine N-acetyltransferase [candidate division LCP-89 bacterium B3_LCP]|uniref:[Ribosomal protein bS18]-alanine N-acetyltransferase n=1 Tax=candidate division LCP-89 bacterium B3_LCP TaxID=2012998 RepID=A0A532UY22_UNCL8|nr:MAG: ribosomal-protein-alanine N-acetyltransferase [candidate division LCP-89 bacterium B3_LCP]